MGNYFLPSVSRRWSHRCSAAVTAHDRLGVSLTWIWKLVVFQPNLQRRTESNMNSNWSLPEQPPNIAEVIVKHLFALSTISLSISLHFQYKHINHFPKKTHISRGKLSSEHASHRVAVPKQLIPANSQRSQHHPRAIHVPSPVGTLHTAPKGLNTSLSQHTWKSWHCLWILQARPPQYQPQPQPQPQALVKEPRRMS